MASRPRLSHVGNLDVAAKVQKKIHQVQILIRHLDRAMESQEDSYLKFLESITSPQNPAFGTLVDLFQKYGAHSTLRCVTLRAMQMIIKINVIACSTFLPQPAFNLGFQCFCELAGEPSANRLVHDIKVLAEATSEDPALTHLAILMLCEFGPERLKPELAPRIFDLLLSLPPLYGPDLVDVALRMHAWRGEHRRWLLETTCTHAAGRGLGELLLDLVNRGTTVRKLRAIKLLAAVVEMPGGESYLYSNDINIWLELMLRELPECRENEEEFAVFADFLATLFRRCPASRMHRQQDLIQMFEDFQEGEGTAPLVRTKSEELLREFVNLPQEVAPKRRKSS